MSITETIINIPIEHEKNVFGNYDSYVKIIEKTLNVTIIERNGEIKVVGNPSDVTRAKSVFLQLLELSKEVIPFLSSRLIMHYLFHLKKKKKRSSRSIRN